MTDIDDDFNGMGPAACRGFEDAAAGDVLTVQAAGGLGWDTPSFVLADPVPEVPATPTAQDIVDALVTLGLVTQAGA